MTSFSWCDPFLAVMQDVKRKCKNDFWSAYAAELVFWPAFQAVNFWKVPLRHQLLAVNLACLLDATFLCWCVSLPPCMHDSGGHGSLAVLQIDSMVKYCIRRDSNTRVMVDTEGYIALQTCGV